MAQGPVFGERRRPGKPSAGATRKQVAGRPPGGKAGAAEAATTRTAKDESRFGHDFSKVQIAMPPAIRFGPNAIASAVSAYTLGVLEDILRAVQLTSVIISSTLRSPRDQARAMYYNLEKTGIDAQWQLYKAAGRAVISVYTQQKKLGRTPEQIRDAMMKRIIEVGPGKVSRHCGDPSKLNVVDVDPASVGDDEKRQAFMHAVRNDKRVTTFLWPPHDPAFHLEIPQ